MYLLALSQALEVTDMAKPAECHSVVVLATKIRQPNLPVVCQCGVDGVELTLKFRA